MYATDIRLHQRHPLPVPTAGVLKLTSEARKGDFSDILQGRKCGFTYSKRYANVKSVLWTLATLPKCVELILNISLSSAWTRKTENAKKFDLQQ